MSQLCKCITNKKPEISTLHKYSYSKLSTLAEATLQPQVFLGMIRHALLISIWQLYTILHLTSSCLKLCLVGWGQTPDSIGFSRMICLGLIPIIVYKPLLLCA